MNALREHEIDRASDSYDVRIRKSVMHALACTMAAHPGLSALAEARARRDAARVKRALASVIAAAGSDENTMDAILEAVRAEASVGEISSALGTVFGYHRASTVV